MKRQKNVRPASSPKVFITSDSKNPQETLSSPTQYIDQVRKLANEVSKRSSQVDQLMQAMNSLEFAFKNPDGLKKLIESLAKLNEAQQKKSSPPPSSEKAGSAPPKLTGDSFYDLFNSPGMREIVKEMFKSKS